MSASGPACRIGAIAIPADTLGGAEVGVVSGAEMGRCRPIVCTCILHLINSIGVSKNEVKAPLTVPQKMRALRGSFSVTRSG